MSNSDKCKDNLNFRSQYAPAEKNQQNVYELLRKINKKLGAAEKNIERVKAICTSFSVLASQSVESSFAGKTKIQMFTTFCRSLTLPIHGFLKSLRL